MKLTGINYHQNGQRYIAMVIPFRIIDKFSKVLIYNPETKEGYQRAPNTNHINRIKKYILDNRESFTLPTSIILGVDEDFVSLHSTTRADNLIEFDFGVMQLEEEYRPFRIVDGQHRIEGIKKAINEIQDHSEKEELGDYKLNVVFLVTGENKQSIELSIFEDINSKGKKVSTDLVELARFNYQLKENNLPRTIQDISEHISIQVAYKLRENNDSVWYYAIKTDVNSENNYGIIGVSSFRKSISSLIQKYLQSNNFDNTGLEDMTNEALEDLIDKTSKKVEELLFECWNRILKRKYRYCFPEGKIQDDFGDFKKVQFSKEYYIQKAMGAKTINKMIEEQYHENDTDFSKLIKSFEELIENSKVFSQHWESGGVFQGYNSESGFNRIRKMIRNEIEIPIE